MGSLKIILGVVIAFGVCFSGATWAADKDSEAVEGFLAGMHRGLAEISEAVGGLSPEQSAKLAMLEKATAERLKANPALLREPGLKDDVIGKFRQILTEAQIAKFDQMMGKSNEMAKQLGSAAKLKQIGAGLLQYALDKGALPPDLGTLVGAGIIEAKDVLSPMSGNTAPAELAGKKPKELADWANAASDFVYLGAGKKAGGGPFDLVVAHEKPEIAKNGINVLLMDGSVHFLKPEQARTVLAELKAGTNPPKSLGKNQ